MRRSQFLLRPRGLLPVAAQIAVVAVPILKAQTPLQPPAIVEGAQRVPQTFPFRSLDGTVRHFSEFRGKVVVVNVWGTWCAACIVEMPSLDRLRDAYSVDPNIAFILLSQLDEPEKLRAFVSRHHLSLPVYYLDQKKLPQALTPVGWPSTFLIDRTGIVRGRYFGGADWSSPVVKRWIEDLKRTNATPTIQPHARRAGHSVQRWNTASPSYLPVIDVGFFGSYSFLDQTSPHDLLAC